MMGFVSGWFSLKWDLNFGENSGGQKKIGDFWNISDHKAISSDDITQKVF